MSDHCIVIQDATDPDEVSRQRRQRAFADLNWAWLKEHWPEIASQASGKFLAVAGRESFVADTLDVAVAWTQTAHGDDPGAIVHYVIPPRGPRSYAVS